MLDTHTKLSSILDVAEDSIISIDQNQNIILFNQGAAKTFQYSPEEVQGKPLDILLPKRFVGSHHQHIENFQQVGKPNQVRGMGRHARIVSGRRKDGTEFPVEASISKLYIQGQIIATVILRDITDRRNLELEKARLANFLESSLRRVIK